MVVKLYAGDAQHENFCRMADFYPSRAMAPSSQPRPWPRGDAMSLPETFSFQGEARATAAFLEATDTSAILVLQGGKLRTEQYFLTGGPEVRWISWSVAKSFVSALIGIALDEGLIGSVDDALSDYVPALRSSGYGGVSIRHVLQMSSGASWNEDYSNRDSDIHRLGRAMAGDEPLAQFVQGVQRATEPGTLCQYNSADTQALGMLLVAVTGSSLADYMQVKLCEPLGFEHPGYWLLDSAGMEMALGGVNLTARDFARIGELYRLGGRWDGQQIVPQPWVDASMQAKADHLQVGKVIVGGHVFPFGYGYQWWIPDGADGEFSAIGVYNQFVYVDPSREAVVVKLSANRAYGTSPEEKSNREEETLAFLRSLTRSLA